MGSCTREKRRVGGQAMTSLRTIRSLIRKTGRGKRAMYRDFSSVSECSIPVLRYHLSGLPKSLGFELTI